MPTLAITWLVPRLAGFRRRHPEIQIRLISTSYTADYEQIDVWRALGKDIDIAFHYSEGPWPGLRSWWLMDSDMFPVCRPDLASATRPLEQPRDLVHHDLVSVNVPSRETDWNRWLEAAGAKGMQFDPVYRFDYSHFAVRAALDGLGVAISHRPFVSADLAAGRLMAPFEFSVPSPHGYHLVCNEADADMPEVVLFRAWILAEAARERTGIQADGNGFSV